MDVGRWSRRRTFVAAAMVAAGVSAALVGTAAGESSTTVAEAHHAQALVDGTPCTAAARSCVDIEKRQAWLLQDGKVVRGPVPIGIGAPDTPTPVGHSLRVYLKDKDHVSSESSTNGVPDGMPYAVFFNDGGIAFHGGDPSTYSGGCIKLRTEDAQVWFDSLQLNDQVQVVTSTEEYGARGLSAAE